MAAFDCLHNVIVMLGKLGLLRDCGLSDGTSQTYGDSRETGSVSCSAAAELVIQLLRLRRLKAPLLGGGITGKLSTTGS